MVENKKIRRHAAELKHNVQNKIRQQQQKYATTETEENI